MPMPYTDVYFLPRSNETMEGKFIKMSRVSSITSMTEVPGRQGTNTFWHFSVAYESTRLELESIWVYSTDRAWIDHHYGRLLDEWRLAR